MLLLKAVVTSDAHLAPHGEAQKRMQDTLGRFMEVVPPGKLVSVTNSKWKTLNDRYKKCVANHCDAVRRNEAASGIIEVRGEREVLFDNIVQEMDKVDEKGRAERDKETDLDG